MLFDTTHILYMVISALITAGLLVLAVFFIKKQEHKNLILKIIAVVTIALHYSNIWVEFFANQGSMDGLEDNHLLLIYPCHIIMWMLLISAFIKNKSNLAFRIMAEFCFWGGVVCASAGIIANINYNNTPSLADWNILKGLLSHSTLLLGCIYLLVGKFIKINMFNVVSVALGLTFFFVDGLVINWLYKICKIPEVNAMYLLYSPFESMPWLNPMLLGVSALIILTVGLGLYELSFPTEERWYVKLKNYKNKFIKQEKEN